MCVVGEKKKKRHGVHGWWGKEKKEIKKKKEMKSGVYVYGGKKWGVEKKKEEKNFEREKPKLVLFVCSFCLMQSIEL